MRCSEEASELFCKWPVGPQKSKRAAEAVRQAFTRRGQDSSVGEWTNLGSAGAGKKAYFHTRRHHVVGGLTGEN